MAVRKTVLHVQAARAVSNAPFNEEAKEGWSASCRHAKLPQRLLMNGQVARAALPDTAQGPVWL